MIGKAVASTLRNSISAKVSEYGKRSNFCYEKLAIRDYLLNGCMYDVLWAKLNSSSRISNRDSRLSITLEPSARDVKYWSRKGDRTAKRASESKRHDICVGSDEGPVCVVEVKRFTNRHGVIDTDVKPLEATIAG